MMTPARTVARLVSLFCGAALLACLPGQAQAEEPSAPRCLYVEVGTLPIRYIGEALSPAVDGSIEGTPATMLVDTGAGLTYMTMTGATRRDLFLHMTGRFVEGIGGLSRTYSARLKEFSIGPIRGPRRTELDVIGSTTFTPAFDAIIGAPFLLQADLEIDLHDKRMRFFRPKDCRDRALTIWKEDTVAVPFGPNYSRSPNPHFTVVVNGKEVDAVIDSGAHRSFIALGAAKRVGIDVGGPGVVRLADSGGVGADRAPRWSAPVKTVQIGDEIIRDAEIGVIDSQGSLTAELYLGQDFLRAHRVLFAMSQEKLYFAYLGGDVFTRGTGLEPWMREEAEAGNPDAQFRLAAMYGTGRGVARDTQQSKLWLDKAAAAGQPHANLRLGRQHLLAGKAAEAIPPLRKALDQLPAERYGPLWLYNARVRNGEAELARSELEASLKAQKEDDWPRPIARFYLGQIDAAGLLDEAGKEQKFARNRNCQANGYMSEWYAAQGDKARADSLLASVRAHCVPAQAPGAAAKPAAPPTEPNAP